MNVILFEDKGTWESLLPFTFTRPVSEMRVGILKISEKWKKHLGTDKVSFITEEYLADKYKLHLEKKNLYVNGCVCPNPSLVQAIQALEGTQVLKKGDLLIAHYDFYIENPLVCDVVELSIDVTTITHKHDIFVHNGAEIRNDFSLITKGRTSAAISDRHTVVYNAENIFIEEGAIVRACVLNAETGPIYIGKQAEIREGALVRGPFAILEHSTLNMGAKIQGDTTIGPHSKIGGEVSNSVIFGFSNKGHDGFMGNTVIGEWCNLGADTNTSNLKNNYSSIKVWSYASKDFVNTNRQFHGLMMGDYSKAGINTMFNTGTVVGVSANIFGAGFPPKFVPSFAWGGAENMQTFTFDLAVEAAQRMYERRSLNLDDNTKAVLLHVFQEEELQRATIIQAKKEIDIIKEMDMIKETFLELERCIKGKARDLYEG